MSEKKPAGQVPQEGGVLGAWGRLPVPAGPPQQTVAPGGENESEGQGRQVEEEVAPCSALYVLALHWVQIRAPGAAQEPTGQQVKAPKGE